MCEWRAMGALTSSNDVHGGFEQDSDTAGCEDLETKYSVLMRRAVTRRKRAVHIQLNVEASHFSQNMQHACGHVAS
jgi:hypothetical protein